MTCPSSGLPRCGVVGNIGLPEIGAGLPDKLGRGLSPIAPSAVSPSVVARLCSVVFRRLYQGGRYGVRPEILQNLGQQIGSVARAVPVSVPAVVERVFCSRLVIVAMTSKVSVGKGT